MTAIARIARRSLLLGGGAAIGYAAGLSWAPGVSQSDVPPVAAPQTDGLVLNDASELSATPVHSHVRRKAAGDALVEAFRA